MQIEERNVGHITVVKLSGQITLSDGGDVLLRDKIRSLLQQERRRILIDLGEVSYMDSAGLGQLVQVYATTRKAGGELKLVHLTKRLQDLLVITRLVTVFESFDSEESAIASFGASS
jgi:anti-sigma B factor antagonist